MEFNFSFESLKQNFFGKAATDILTKEEKRALGRMGSYTRTIARNLLKYPTEKRKVSAAGEPPVVHRFQTRVRLNKKTGETKVQQVSPLKELLFFAYDPSTKSTVVGPVLFNSSRKSAPSASTVPQILEKGGNVQSVELVPVKTGRGRPASPAQKKAFLSMVKSGRLTVQQNFRTVFEASRHAPRPFMKPAMVKALPKFPDLFISRG